MMGIYAEEVSNNTVLPI